MSERKQHLALLTATDFNHLDFPFAFLRFLENHIRLDALQRGSRRGLRDRLLTESQRAETNKTQTKLCYGFGTVR